MHDNFLEKKLVRRVIEVIPIIIFIIIEFDILGHAVVG